MRTLGVFNMVSLDGYFVDANGDMSWAKVDRKDPEWDQFVAGNVKGGGILVFGRKTYDLMASYWPTPAAKQNDPLVAERMNKFPKIVFSRKMDEAAWENTEVVNGDPVTEVKRMKEEPGKDMVILGSGTIVSQLTQAGLIDDYMIVVIPIAIGRGRTLFEGVRDRLNFKLKSSRAFGNGNVLLRYEPARD